MMKKILMTLMMAVALAGCAENAPATLKGKSFVLQNDKNITLSFDAKEDRFAGKVLNNYFGSYTVEGNNIKFGAIASTMMAGPEAEMKKEQSYFQNLGKVKTYSLKNKTLELQGDGVTLTYQQQ